MENLPQDPFMLLSFINMRLRDGDYDSLEQLCDDLGISPDDLKARMGAAGFEYLPEGKRFA